MYMYIYVYKNTESKITHWGRKPIATVFRQFWATPQIPADDRNPHDGCNCSSWIPALLEQLVKVETRLRSLHTL